VATPMCLTRYHDASQTSLAHLMGTESRHNSDNVSTRLIFLLRNSREPDGTWAPIILDTILLIIDKCSGGKTDIISPLWHAVGIVGCVPLASRLVGRLDPSIPPKDLEDNVGRR